MTETANAAAERLVNELFARLARVRDVAREVPGIIADFSAAAIARRFTARQQARHDQQRAAIAGIYRAALHRVLARAEAETVRGLHSQAPKAKSQTSISNTTLGNVSAAVGVFDLTKFKKDFFATMAEAGKEAWIESARGAVSALGIDASQVTDAGIIQRFINKRANKMADIPDDVYAQIKQTLEEGAQAGETMDDMAKRVQATFSDISEGRADLIARTETASAYSDAALESMRAAGITRKRWVTAHDERVRISHSAAEMEGAIPIDQPFGNGLMEPADPDGPAEEVINCRCYIEAVDGGDETSPELAAGDGGATT